MGTFQYAMDCCTSHSSCRVFQGSCFQLCCATGASCSKRDTWQSSALEKEDQEDHPFRSSYWLSSLWAAECRNASLSGARHTRRIKQQGTMSQGAFNAQCKILPYNCDDKPGEKGTCKMPSAGQGMMCSLQGGAHLGL